MTAAAAERNSGGVGPVVVGPVVVGPVVVGPAVAGRAVTGTLAAKLGRLTTPGVAGRLTGADKAGVAKAGAARAGAIAAEAVGVVRVLDGIGADTATVRRGPAILAAVSGRFPAVAAATGAVPCAVRD